ncbi:MAG: type VI secretion system tube protein Hcp [Phycisphaeraceae bacterium]|nr:type VI secretion system tube protein Hcp [Phycisphaeraceae bacterium]MCB9848746.1 type VI secretion system tube protein Hcp [Phycisphaeraceae bacterium]
MRKNSFNGLTIGLAAALTLGVAYVAYSGQLYPPDGGISPTGASLNDIYLRLAGAPEPPRAVDPGMAGFPSVAAVMHIVPGESGAVDPGPITVLGFSHSISTPRDSASGLPTGRRQHKPFTITKPIDKSTPLLMNALVRNDVFEVIEISSADALFPRGIDVPAGPIRYALVGARVASVSPFTRGMGPDAVVYMEQVEIVYDRIIVTWEDGGITAQDDWEEPAAG